MAPSLATLRSVMIVDRSTPASAAASTEVISPVSSFSQISYFSSADKNLLGLGFSGMSAPCARARRHHQMRGVSWWMLSPEVRSNGVVTAGWVVGRMSLIVGS